MGCYLEDVEAINHPSPSIWLEFNLLPDPRPEPASSSSPPPLRTFHCFRSLPAEIRLQIYTHALTPRTILLTCKTSEPRSSSTTTATTFPAATPAHTPKTPAPRPRFSAPPPPSLLHVSRETRHFASRHYRPSFGYHISPLHTDTPLRVPARVFFDFARDALLLGGDLEPRGVFGFHCPMVYFLDKAECARVRRVACAGLALRGSSSSAAYDGGGGADAGVVEEEDVDSEVVFIMLSHVLDRFSGVNEVLVPVPDGSTAASCRSGAGAADSTMVRPRGTLSLEKSGPDAIQKIWDGWVLGTTATGSSLRGKRIPMVREEDLDEAWGRC